jgi:hypothetical protein
LRSPKGHVIQDISYQKDMILCVCEWRGPVSEFQQHRKEAEPTTKEFVPTSLMMDNVTFQSRITTVRPKRETSNA